MKNVELAVSGVNALNKLTIENIKKVVPQIELFLGKKVLLADGTTSKKFKIEIYEAPSFSSYIPTFSSYIEVIEYRVYLYNRLLVPTEGIFSKIFRNTIFIGNVVRGAGKDDRGFLKNIQTIEDIIKNNSLDVIFDAIEVQNKLTRIDEIGNEMDELKNKISEISENLD